MPVHIHSFRAACLAVTLSLSSIIIALPQTQAATCHSPNDIHNAFNLAGLKSELMLTALSCQTQDLYNDFVNHFRPLLNKADKKIDDYFHTAYGRYAQKKHDNYITQLADIQSLDSLKSGNVFCSQRIPMFDEIAALETTDDLAHYAEAKNIAQPAFYESCIAPPPPHNLLRNRSQSRHH